MQKEVSAAVSALESLVSSLSSFWADQPLHLAAGTWHTAPIHRSEIAKVVRDLANDVKEIHDDELSEPLSEFLKTIPDRVNWIIQNMLPNAPGGNVNLAVDAIYAYVFTVRSYLPRSEISSWRHVKDAELVPRELAAKIRSIRASLERISPQASALDDKIKSINEAHVAATSLPIEHSTIKEIRAEIEEFRKLTEENYKNVLENVKIINSKADYAKLAEDEVRGVVQNIEQAYSAATTKGLAASFTEKAVGLGRSTWVWVALLSASLIAGGWLGHERLKALQEAVEKSPANTNWIWLNAAMSMIAIAGPVWFAWLSTRQISQRFRLAEDYGFKASVARAYEGYRKEAARLDPEFEARLFSSALDRLEEAPTRFISTDEHASPYEAILASQGFQRALDKIPSLKETVVALADRLVRGGSLADGTLEVGSANRPRGANTKDARSEEEDPT